MAPFGCSERAAHMAGLRASRLQRCTRLGPRHDVVHRREQRIELLWRAKAPETGVLARRGAGRPGVPCKLDHLAYRALSAKGFGKAGNLACAAKDVIH